MARKPDIARRTAIALEAFDVIKARGLHRTTMSVLAAEIGIKRPTLYWYFKDFGEIFDAVVRDTDAALVAHVQERLVGVTHPLDTLAALVEATIDFYDARRDQVTVLFQLWTITGDVAPGRIAQRAREFIDPVRAELMRRLEQGIAEGTVAPCDPGGVVDLAFAVIDGAHVQRVTRDADPHRLLAELRRHVFEPLRRPGPAPDLEDRS